LKDHGNQQIELVLVGRKGRDYFRRRNVSVSHEHVGIFVRLNYMHAKQVGEQIIPAYAEQKTDAVFLIYNEFKSVISQKLTVEQLLPLAPFTPTPGVVMVDYIYEQPPAELFARLLPRYVETQIFRALLESAAAEHAARMTSMDSATNNAGDMIEGLTLNMNRIRQAAITKELIEVVSGAAAL
jgi:F-type H+-transporting ATPase subunit gamma